MSTSEYSATTLREPRRISRPSVAESIRRVPVEVWLLGALIVVAAVIRIITIDNQSFWRDEALTAYEASLPFGAMIHTVATIETTPPLYFVLIWAWAHVFGTSEVALRSVSTIAGIALVPIAYLAARDLVSRWAGVLAAAFVTVNPFMIWYSQEARSYMLLAALCGASFLWFVRARNEPSSRNLAWWALFSALALMTHFFAGFLVAPEALWLLWIARSRAAAAAVAVVAVVQLAMLPLAVTDTGHGANWIAQVRLLHRIAITIMEWGVSLLERRGSTALALGALTALVVIVVLLLALGGERATRRGAAVAASIAAFVFVAPLALALVGQDYFLSRNEIPAFVPLVTVVAAACAAPRARIAGTAFAVALLAMFSVAAVYVQTHGVLERPDWRAVARALGPSNGSRAILATGASAADPLKIYLPGVSWVQPQHRMVTINEIAVVGVTKRSTLVQQSHPGDATAAAGAPRRGWPLPRSVAPRGTRLLARFHEDNWVIARFALLRPIRISVSRLYRLAPRFFRATPAGLNIFIQRGLP